MRILAPFVRTLVRRQALCKPRREFCVAVFTKNPRPNSSNTVCPWKCEELQTTNVIFKRCAGTFHVPYTLKHIEDRVMLVLKLFDKIDPAKFTVDSHFYNDCGLDSLDHVEIVVAIEDEFEFEIPEQYHYRLMRPRDIVQYVADRFDIFE